MSLEQVKTPIRLNSLKLLFSKTQAQLSANPIKQLAQFFNSFHERIEDERNNEEKV